MDRRDFLCGAGALAATKAAPAFATAEVKLAEAVLTTVSDGTLVLPGEMIFDAMPQDELAPILSDFGLSRERLEPECNVTLLRDGPRTVVFDAGAGPDFMPSAGKLLDSLAAVDVAPGDVTHVVFTHAHPDHIWGVLDVFDEPLFPEAAYMMGRAEWDYWWSPETVDRIGAARAAFAVGARRRMEAIEKRVIRFGDGEEILPGIAALETPGHTPGHMAFEVRKGGDAAMIVGDAIGNHHVAFRQPGWHSGSDQDPELAAMTRQRLLDRLAYEQIAMIGFHLPEGGIGRVERNTDAYRFVAS